MPVTSPACASARSTAGSVGDQPSAPVITWLEPTRSSSTPRVVSFRPAATTVTSVTSAMPIVSAVAVATVRPGWRIALRRASPPAAPPSACAGRPSSDASARAARAGSRSRPPSCDDARSASTGATRVARHAGSRPAASVTSVPTSIATTIVRAANTVPASGSASPIASNIASSASASP